MADKSGGFVRDDYQSRIFGDYRIGREIGRGGMGRVYEAEQISLHRRVAIKMLPQADLLSPQRLQRFRNEAMIAAQLKHPNVVSVHSVGCDRGVHFYAMEYVEGRNLEEIIDELRTTRQQATIRNTTSGHASDSNVTKPWCAPPEDRTNVSRPVAVSNDRQTEPSTPNGLQTLADASGHRSTLSQTFREGRGAHHYREIARLMLQATNALDHAHHLGVVHRDIKPSNLILNTNGTLLVTDFGLARVESDSSLTASGAFLGTLRYMSPEQASGEREVLDERSDIYSLGATMFELLTLEPMVRAKDRAELLKRLLHEEEHLLPRKLEPTIPRDLETIVLKATAKNPRERYKSAREFGDDLDRFLKHRPLLAQRPSMMSWVGKWARRNWGAMVSVSLLLLLGALALLVSTILISGAQLETSKALRKAERQMRMNELLLYVSDMKLAERALADDDLRRLTEILRRYVPQGNERDLRGFEWGYLWQKARSTYTPLISHSGGTYRICYSIDGRSLATCGADDRVRIYRRGRQQPEIVITTEQKEINGVSFDRRAQRVVTAGDDGTVCVWDLKTGSRTLSILAHDDLAFDALFLEDRGLIVTCGRDPIIRLWDLTTGEPGPVLEGHSRSVEAIRISPNRRYLASASSDMTARIWDLDTREVVHELVSHERRVISLAYSKDGRHLVTGDIDGTVIVWDTVSGTPIASTRQLDGAQSLAFSPGGERIAIGDRGGCIHLWPYLTDDATASWRAHEGRVYTLTFDSEGKELLSGEQNGQARRWRLAENIAQWTLDPPGKVNDFIFLPGNRKLAIASGTGLHVCDATGGQSPHALDSQENWTTVAVSRDGTWLSAGTADGNIETWNMDSGQRYGRWRAAHGSIDSLAVLDDCRVAWLSGSKDDRVFIADAVDGHDVQSLACEGCELMTLSPNEKWLAVGAHGNLIWLWNLSTGTDRKLLRGHISTVVSLTFSPDSATLYSASNDRSFKSWDVDSGAPKSSTIAHLTRLKGIAVTENGLSLATIADREEAARLWCAQTGQPVLSIAAPKPYKKIAFSPGSTYLAGLRTDGFIEVIDATIDETAR